MPPIEWTRLSGEAVEDLTTALLGREYSDCTRIRASVGDGGIDLIHSAKDGRSEVYQVKKFSNNLTSSQKTQIKKSIQNFDKYRSEEKMSVAAWHLVMPLDPTKENYNWLRKLTSNLPYSCHWKGLTFLDGLAAKYPEVVDYYIEGGRQRLEKTITDLAALLKLECSTAEGTIPISELRERFAKVASLLRTDPFYEYEILMGSETKPSFPNRRPVAMTHHRYGNNREVEVIVLVFARCNMSLELRPISAQFNMTLEPDSLEEKKFETFLKYGTPFQSPSKGINGSIELPGGLGGEFNEAQVTFEPLQQNLENQYIRINSLDPRGAALGSVVIKLTSRNHGPDGTGLRAVGREEGGNFEMEFLYDKITGSQTINVNRVAWAGNPPHEVKEALLFLSSLKHPNRLALGSRYGKLKDLGEIPKKTATAHHEQVDSLLQVASDLAVIQEAMDDEILMPDQLSKEDVAIWHFAARLLSEGAASLRTESIPIHLNRDTAPPKDPFSFLFYDELTVPVNSQLISLGTVQYHCPAAQVDPRSIKSHEDHFDCTVTPCQGSQITGVLLSEKDDDGTHI